jgi:hypothetical protein
MMTAWVSARRTRPPAGATILLFDSLEHVRGFAGEDDEAAYVPPRARAVLAHFGERSAHYDMLLRPRTI